MASTPFISLGGLSSEYLFIEPFPDRHHDLIWGTLKPGGMTFTSAIGVVVTDQNRSTKRVLGQREGGFGVRREDGSKGYAEFQANDVAFHPQNSNIAILATPNENRVVLTRDRFQSYQTIYSFKPKKPLRVLIPRDGKSVLVAGFDGLWRATIDTWESNAFKFEHLIDRCAATGALAEGPDHFFYGADHGLYWCRKGESRFERFPIETPVAHMNDVLQVDSSDIIIATRGGGLFRLSPTMKNWSQVASAGPMSVSYGWSSPEFSLVGADASLFQSIDGGKTFKLLRGLPGNILTLREIEIEGARKPPRHQLRSAATRASLAYVEALLLAGVGKWLYRKGSGDTTWNKVQLSVEGAVGTIAQSISQSNYIAVVISGKLFISRDYGENWMETPSSESYTYYSVFPNPVGGFLISALNENMGYLLKSKDDGSNQNVVREFGKGVTALAALNQEELLFGVIDGTVFAYSPNATTFSDSGRLPIESSQWIDFAVANSGQIYASCLEGQVFSSSDRGQT